MKNLLTLILLAIVVISCRKDNEPIYNGNVTLTTQSELNEFGKNNYEVINGDLLIGIIEDGAEVSNIDDLSPLSNLKKAKYNFTIARTNITSLTGLSNLNNVGNEFLIDDNDSLNSIKDLGSLTYSGGLIINGNRELETLSGLEGIETIQGILKISYNTNLLNLNGLNNLKSVANELHILGNQNLTDIKALSNFNNPGWLIDIQGNKKLSNLDGLEGLYEVKSLSIVYNKELANIEGLKNLREVWSLSISYSEKLTNLDAIQDLETAWALNFKNNIELTDFCGLTNVLKSSPRYYRISENKHNPTRDEILSGNCAMN
jgi:hypothetical protein